MTASADAESVARNPGFANGDHLLAAALEEFRRDCPAFESASTIDELRARDFARLDQQRQVYLDFTGAGLPAASHVRDHLALLTAAVFGNPHSKNSTSMTTTALVEQARNRVLAFFNASPDEYEVIFTPNATGALKLVGESYPFAPGGACLLTFDNHNSVNGIREFARRQGAKVTYIPLSVPDLRVNATEWEKALAIARRGALAAPRAPEMLRAPAGRRPRAVRQAAVARPRIATSA